MERAAPVGVAQGYDSITGEGLNTALTVTSETVEAESIVRYEVCESLEQVMSALEINQSLSVGLGPIFSINQKLEFVESRDITTHTVTIVMYAKKTAGRQMVTNAQLRDGVMPPQTPAELANFVQVYGDSYLVSRTIGGEYFAAYSYYAETQEQQNSLIVSMETAGIFKPISVGVELQVALNDFNSSHQSRYTFDQRVTGISNPSFPSPNGIIEFAQDYLSMELNAPTIIAIETYGYERVPGIGTSFNAVRQNVQRLTSFSYLSVLNRVKNDIKPMVDLYNAYGADIENDEKLHRVQKQVDAGLEAFKTAHSDYRTNPGNPVNILQVDEWVQHAGVPSLQFSTRSMRFAGPYDIVQKPFDDVGNDVRGFLLEHKRITAFQMTKAPPMSGAGPSEHLSSLIVTYRNSTGDIHTVIHGFSGSSVSQRLSVPNPSSIRQLTTTGPVQPTLNYVIYANQLTIELSNGETLQFGNDTPHQNLQSGREIMTTPSKHFVLGFRTSSQLTFWEVIYASLLPCIWL